MVYLKFIFTKYSCYCNVLNKGHLYMFITSATKLTAILQLTSCGSDTGRLNKWSPDHDRLAGTWTIKHRPFVCFYHMDRFTNVLNLMPLSDHCSVNYNPIAIVTAELIRMAIAHKVGSWRGFRQLSATHSSIIYRQCGWFVDSCLAVESGTWVGAWPVDH